MSSCERWVIAQLFQGEGLKCDQDQWRMRFDTSQLSASVTFVLCLFVTCVSLFVCDWSFSLQPHDNITTSQLPVEVYDFEFAGAEYSYYSCMHGFCIMVSWLRITVGES